MSSEIIKSLHVHSKKRRKELSEYLDKNWDEIFSIFEARTENQSGPVSGSAELTGTSIAVIRRMLKEVLQNRNIIPVAAGVAAGAGLATVKAVAKKPAAVNDVEDEVEEIEEAEELDEVEELAEEAEPVEELDDAEELDEVEDLDEVEELEEEAVEDAEAVEELDEVEEIEDAEELDEVEELDDAEELDEVEELEEEPEDAEELDEPEELEDVEELEELEEVEEPASSNDNPLLNMAIRRPVDYIPSNETYFMSEKFANVENLYAEELRLGSGIRIKKKKSLEDEFLTSKLVDVKAYQVPPYQHENQEVQDAQPVEEVLEEVVEEEKTVFSLTNFAENFGLDIPELEEASAGENVIVENDGVYSISENIEYTNIVQDPEFKELVESIL